LDEFGSKTDEAFRLFVREAVLEKNVLAFDVAEVSKTLHKSAKRYLFLFGATSVP
jgi:arginase family enzyme